MLDAALAYLARGWSVIPLYAPVEGGGCNCGDPHCTSQGKHPAVPDFRTYHKRLATPEEINNWFGGAEARNIGISTGSVSGDLVVIDCDDRGTYDSLCYRYPELHESLTAETGKGHHIYTIAPTLGTVTFVANGLRHHVQSDGRQVVAPPSLHYSGRRYAFRDPDAEPLVLDLPRLRSALLSIGGRKEEPGGPAHPPGWWAELLRDGAKPGERDEMTFRLAGHLSYRLPSDEVEEILTLWAETRCAQPPGDPWGREQVRAKMRSSRP